MVGYSYKAVEDNVSCNDFMDRADLLIERNRLYADNCDLEAEWNRLRAINSELLAALKDTVELARKAMTQHGTDAEYADARLEKALTAIAKAEGKQ
jgi:hypothetical protein